MASSGAQTYFNSFPAVEQQKIRASWAGNPNGMEDWFRAAVSAGAVNPDGNPRTAGGHNYEEGSSDYSAGYNQPSGLKAGQIPTPAQLRAYARENGWSEDFNRFDDATLQGWIQQSWDPSSMHFKSARGAEGSYEKPTECPPGLVPGGPNETDGCVDPKAGGEQQQPPDDNPLIISPGTGTGTKAQEPTGLPGLQQALVDKFVTRGGGFGATTNGITQDLYGQSLNGGGLWWGGQQDMFNKDNAGQIAAAGAPAAAAPKVANFGVKRAPVPLVTTPEGGTGRPGLPDALLNKRRNNPYQQPVTNNPGGGW